MQGGEWMKVITEIELRDLYRKKPFESFTVHSPEKLTPAAAQFLTERRIRIIEDGGTGSKAVQDKPASPEVTVKPVIKDPDKGYILMDSLEVVETKPEAYTHLRGKRLVPKNNKRIKFRGMVDTLEACFINTIVDVQGAGYSELTKDLNLIFEYTRKIMRAEVLDETLEFIDFKGWNDEDIREYSHYPDKYFGVKHFSPDPKYGRVMASLNYLRTQVRQTEIAAVDAFYDREAKTVSRQDIIMALNRMSSLMYILMCQYLGGLYKL